MGRARHDDNLVPSLIVVSELDGSTPVEAWADENTHEILVRATTSAANTATKIDKTTTAGMIYIGKAAIGSVGSDPVWQIKRLNTNVIALDKQWADGNDAFDNVWDNRATTVVYS